MHFGLGGVLESRFHMSFSGVGDMRIKEVALLPDPCPLPDKEKKRSLDEREKLLYAPFSGVGGIVYDKDAVYIEYRGNTAPRQEKVRTFARLLSDLARSDDFVSF